MKPAKGKALTKLAELNGFKRRWFGLEPDFIFRKRVLKNLTEPPKPKNPFDDCPKDIVNKAELLRRLYGSSIIVFTDGKFKALSPQQYMELYGEVPNYKKGWNTLKNA